jgi:hypothetical protein
MFSHNNSGDVPSKYQYFVSTSCQLRTCSCYFLLLQVPGIIRGVQLRSSLCLGVWQCRMWLELRWNGQCGGHSRAVASATQHLKKPALRHCGWKVYLSEADTRRWQRTPREAIARLESDSELWGPGKQRPSLAQSLRLLQQRLR